jgi:hypothetical protein
MNTPISFAIAGCLGGITKSLIGIFKAKTRKEKIKIGYILRTLKFSIISGTIIGAFVGYGVSSFLVGYLAGYIGSDTLEGFYRSFKCTKFWKKQFNV